MNKGDVPRAHAHGEAFMLMAYQCQECGHREIFWNSRDGVTPFGCACPQCPHGDMVHVDWGADVYAPSWCPLPGQGVWVDIPPSLVSPVVRMTLRVYEQEHGPAPVRLVESLEAQYPPGTPWLLRWPDDRPAGGDHEVGTGG